LAAGLAAACSFSVYGIQHKAAQTLADDQVVQIAAGAPTKGECVNASVSTACVSVPMVFTEKSADGQKHSVPVDMPVSPSVLVAVKQRFPKDAPVVLRNLKDALHKGLKAHDPVIKQACANTIPSVAPHVHYSVLPDITMPADVETKVAQVAEKNYELTQRDVVVTSGTRTPEAQAEAMRTKLALGDNVEGLYRNKKAVDQVLHAYRAARHEGKDDEETTDAMAGTIQQEMSQGVYISNHLHDNAVDLRISDLNGWQKRVLKESAESVPGVTVHQESIPPHYHLDVF